jgi:hypothetical protein
MQTGVKLASVQSMARGINFIQAAPPCSNEIHDALAGELKHHQKPGHQDYPGPKTDLDVSSRDQSENE